MLRLCRGFNGNHWGVVVKCIYQSCLQYATYSVTLLVGFWLEMAQSSYTMT
jgi:hypothetical protein